MRQPHAKPCPHGVCPHRSRRRSPRLTSTRGRSIERFKELVVKTRNTLEAEASAEGKRALDTLLEHGRKSSEGANAYGRLLCVPRRRVCPHCQLLQGRPLTHAFPLGPY